MASEQSTRRLVRGAAAGVAASVTMGMYAMLVSLYHDAGFFTPLHHIASSVGSAAAMMESMAAAADGDSTFIVPGSAVLGASLHMMVGALAGVAFATLLGLRPVGRSATLVAGVTFGLLLMLVNTVVVLPIAARVLGGGAPIADMAAMVGWLTFTVEHALFGLVLGLIVSLLRSLRTQPVAGHPAHAERG